MEAQVKGVVKMMDYQVTNIQRAYKDVFTLTSFALKLKKKKKKWMGDFISRLVRPSSASLLIIRHFVRGRDINEKVDIDSRISTVL